MNLKDERKLKYDRRLVGHEDWISDGELESELSQLPDATDKMYDRARDDAGSTDEPSAKGDAGAPAAPTNLA
jgi:hypothetical protein